MDVTVFIDELLRLLAGLAGVRLVPPGVEV